MRHFNLEVEVGYLTYCQAYIARHGLSENYRVQGDKVPASGANVLGQQWRIVGLTDADDSAWAAWSEAFQQDCVALWCPVTGSGVTVGPRAHVWPFDKQFFVEYRRPE